MRKLSLAILFLGASCLFGTVLSEPSSAATCSSRYRTCLRICPHGETCSAGCSSIRSECLRTGCWTSMVEHKCGY